MSKGSDFERELCKRLSLWWTGGEADDVFWRTSQSGGRATIRQRKGKATAGAYGDIAATDERGVPFLRFMVLELKRGYNRCVLHDLLDKPANASLQGYEKWIEQAKASQTQAGSRFWAIIHKRDRREPLIVVSYEMWNVLEWKMEIPPNKTFFHAGELDLVALPLASFLDWVSPSVIQKL